MKEIPILFSGPMIPPLLDGTKTQTRRLITTRHPLTHIGPKGSQDDPDEWGYFFDGPRQHGYMVLGRGHNDQNDHGLVSIPCPYGEAGDRLWCRETWRTAAAFDADSPSRISAKCLDAGYEKAWGPAKWEADGQSSGGIDDFGGIWGKLRPSIFMPRWASRIKLEVTEVRVQRLHAITEDDAKAEGVAPFFERFPMFHHSQRLTSGELACDSPYRASYAVLWDEINGDRALWLVNPFVWAVTFKRIP